LLSLLQSLKTRGKEPGEAQTAVTLGKERSGASGALPKPRTVADLSPYIAQSTSGAFAPNPQLSLINDEADKLSDYIPGSNEVSRVPSAVPSASEDESEEEEEEEEEEGADQDGDVQMAGGSPKKTPGVLRKEMAAKERTKKKKEAKKDMDDKVRCIHLLLCFSTKAETPTC